MFQLLSKDPGSEARRGRLVTSHGIIETPQYMPVGTQASVKAVAPRDLDAMGTEIILGNTYHLFLRPGLEVFRKFGGLHKFMNWHKPILTDSGGFQVFSLAKLREITEAGVEFRSHLDGSKFFLGPKEAVAIQHALGSDILMAFDECPPWPCEEAKVNDAVQRTIRWARASLDHHRHLIATEPDRPTAQQALFGIVQGGSYANLRADCAGALVEMDFDGYAIGGVSVGEPEEEMYRTRRGDRAASAAAQGALRDGARPAAPAGGTGRARDRYLRLRAADPRRAPRHGLHAARDAESARRAVQNGPAAARTRLRLLCLSNFHPRLYSALIQSG